jgi:hypothetical protein
MSAENLQRLDSSLGQGPDWFWEWVEINQANSEALPEWFHQASSAQLLQFWRTFYDEISGSMLIDDQGILFEDGEGFYFSEDDLVDFYNWVIVQGKPVWEALVKEAKLRRQNPGKYDDSNLESIFRIFRQSQQALDEGQSPPAAKWKGVAWQPRNGYFPGDTADYIYEERFGITLWEQR